jgi:hypothetical protein
MMRLSFSRFPTSCSSHSERASLASEVPSTSLAYLSSHFLVFVSERDEQVSAGQFLSSKLDSYLDKKRRPLCFTSTSHLLLIKLARVIFILVPHLTLSDSQNQECRRPSLSCPFSSSPLDLLRALYLISIISIISIHSSSTSVSLL